MKKITVFRMVQLFMIPAFFFVHAEVRAQNASGADDPSSLVGMTLADLFAGYGTPKLVYPVRGTAAWQDDVVFVYDTADGAEFFISGNRVWQIKFRSACGIKEGDPRTQVLLTLGPEQSFESYSLFQLPNRVWPIALRVNWDASKRVQAIYVYRSDF